VVITNQYKNSVVTVRDATTSESSNSELSTRVPLLSRQLLRLPCRRIILFSYFETEQEPRAAVAKRVTATPVSRPATG
jgi:hypothetical protein